MGDAVIAGEAFAWAGELQVMDEVHTNRPFVGSRRMVDELAESGYHLNRKAVRRLMRLAGIEAVYRRPRTSRKGSGAEHRVFPYLLGGLAITRANQVWASDVTYIPMRRALAYLVVVMDVFSRRVLSWRLSNTMCARFCVDALEEAIAWFGVPEIFNTDQGSQFTSAPFTGVLEQHGVRISMDGKGRWLDNVFLERFWWSLKYEEVYLHAYDDLIAARRGIAAYLAYYNSRRRHSSLGRRTPAAVYAGEAGKAALVTFHPRGRATLTQPAAAAA